MYLFGDGADGSSQDPYGQVVPKDREIQCGVSEWLWNNGSYEWCGNRIKRVTDELAILGVRLGTR